MRIEGSASLTIAAPVEQLWEMVTDVTRMGEWSPETFECRWIGTPGPALGAVFQGSNHLAGVGVWRSKCTVTEAEPLRTFSFVVGNDPRRPNTEWSFGFAGLSDGTTVVTERYRMIREPLIVRVYYAAIDRSRQLESGVIETLRRLQQAAESERARPGAAPRDHRSPSAQLRRATKRAPESRRFDHPLFARIYACLSPAADDAGSRAHRRSLLADLHGEVIEVGCGNGLNFAHYPVSVTGVTAVEPDRYLRIKAESAAAVVPTPIRVVNGHAGALPVGENTFDAAVVSLVLCSVDDPEAALAEIRRVLRPGGELRFYEHVRAYSDPLLRGQQLAGPLWQRLAGGCHPDRDTESAIVAAGFQIEHIDRFDHIPGPRFPIELVRPHILGTAIKPPTEPSMP